MRFALLAIKKNISFYAMKDVVGVSQHIFNKDELARNLKLKTTKLRSIVVDVFGMYTKNKIVSEMRCRPFSILVDESTDQSKCKNLCIVVKYFFGGCVRTQVLDLVELEADGATGINLYKTVKEVLTKHELSVENIVGFSSDNASSMTGKNEGVAAYLLKDNPNVFVLGCICHTAHLIASTAALTLPRICEDLLSMIYSYFSRSPKRQKILEEIQSWMKGIKHRIINPSKTRWLALHACIVRVLDQWDVLTNVFRLAMVEDRTTTGELIFNELQNPCTKAYLQFLDHVLPNINNFNKLFQSEKPLIDRLYEESCRLVRLIGANFLKPNYLKENKLASLDLMNLDIYLPLSSVNIGTSAENGLEGLTDSVKNEFRSRCLKYYKELMKNCLTRLPLKDTFLKTVFILSPSVVLNPSRHKINFAPIFEKFPFINQNAQQQYFIISTYFNETEHKELKLKNIEQFWSYLYDFKNFNDENPFIDICQLAIILLTLPHANADVERVFSMCADIKTKKRNRLNGSAMAALVKTKIDLGATTDITNFKITKQHIEAYNKYMYLTQKNTNEPDSEPDSDN